MLEDKDLLVVQLDLSSYLGAGSGWKSVPPSPQTNVYAAGIGGGGVTLGKLTVEDDDGVLNDDNDPEDPAGGAGLGYSDYNQTFKSADSALDTSLYSPGAQIEIAGIYRLTGSDGTDVLIYEINAQPLDTTATSHPKPIFVIDKASYDSNVDFSGGAGATYQLETFDGRNIPSINYEGELGGATVNFDDLVPCFVRGVEIMTIDGPRVVEDLKTGDVLQTYEGEQRTVLSVEKSLARLHEKNRPICFPEGIFVAGEALQVSPQHRILARVMRDFDDYHAGDLVFFPAKSALGLVEGVHEAPGYFVEYFHILLSAHSSIASNGVWTESFFPGKTVMAALREDQVQRICEALSVDDVSQLEEAYPLAFPSLTVREARQGLSQGCLAIETVEGQVSPSTISAGVSKSVA